MPGETLSHFAAINIRRHMLARGLNPGRLAALSGVNDNGIRDILKGRSSSPRLDTLQKIAENGLGITVQELLIDPTTAEGRDDLVAMVEALPPDEVETARAILRAIVSRKATQETPESPRTSAL